MTLSIISIGVLCWEEHDAHADGFLFLLSGLIWGHFHRFANVLLHLFLFFIGLHWSAAPGYVYYI